MKCTALKNNGTLVVLSLFVLNGPAWAGEALPVVVTGVNAMSIFSALVGIKVTPQGNDDSIEIKTAELECAYRRQNWVGGYYSCTLWDKSLPESASPIQLYTEVDLIPYAHPKDLEAKNLYDALFTAIPGAIGTLRVNAECRYGRWDSSDLAKCVLSFL